MMDLADYAAAVVDVAEGGGRVVGKTRLQKIAYLLEAMGLGNELNFDYYKYGPFSAEFALGVDDAEAVGYVETEEKEGYHAVPYKVYRTRPGAPKFDKESKHRERSKAVRAMDGHSDVVLELAASAVYLGRVGYADSVWDEVRQRKGAKASEYGLNAATELVENLQL